MTEEPGRRYNDNITLLRVLPYSLTETVDILNKRPLKEDEYLALMVEDDRGRRGDDDTRTFFDELQGWLGLEKTSGENGIYISKNLSERFNPGRGRTVIVHVKDPSKCREL